MNTLEKLILALYDLRPDKERLPDAEFYTNMSWDRLKEKHPGWHEQHTSQLEKQAKFIMERLDLS